MENMYQCKICNKEYQNKQAFAGHISMSHSGRDWPPYKGKRLPEEQKRRISTSLLQSYSSGRCVASRSFLGKHHTEEAKKGMSLAQKGKAGHPNPHTAEWNRKISLAHKGKIMSLECRLKLSQILKEKYRLGLIENPSLRSDVRVKLSNANKGRVRSQEFKDRVSKGVRTAYQNPALRKKISEAKKRNWSDPNYRLKQMSKIHTKPTKPELKFIQICAVLGLPYKYTGDGSFWVENINPDFVECNGKKIAIEIFGHAWHDPNYGFKPVGIALTDTGRKETFSKYGWQCIIFWDSEIMSKNAEELVLERLRSY